MSTEQQRSVKVYACKKRADTYLYLDADQDVLALDEALKQTLGELRFVLDLELHSKIRLAMADPIRVLRALEESGYYLQVPPAIPKVVLNP